jgi:HK97 family phage major capsid protein
MRATMSQALPRAAPRAESSRRLHRFLQAVATPTVDTASRTARLSFSSETPVEQPFVGLEVLSHAPGAVDLSRLNARASLLFNHDADDVLGVVESASVGADRIGRAVVRFGRDQRGDWAMQQVEDGVLCNVSVTYVVDEYQQQGDTCIATRWMPVEISIVSVPADPSVGIGRSFTNHRKDRTMNHETQHDELALAPAPTSRRGRAAEAALDERERVQSIIAMCRRYNAPDMERRLIDDGATVEEARAIFYRRAQANAPLQRPVAAYPGDDGGFGATSSEVGLSDAEIGSYSIVRAVAAMASGDWSKAGLERQASRAMEQQHGRSTPGLLLPGEVLARGWLQSRATYQVGTPSAGGNLVATNLLADQFIEALRNVSQVMNAGATVLSGLVGNVDIPRQTALTATYWVAESGAPTEAEMTFDKVSLTPKTVAALSKMSRLMLTQSTPAIEQLVRNDLVKGIALAMDLAALSGTGASNQPMGIASQSGVQQQVMGTNGAAITLDALSLMEQSLNAANAPMDGRGFILNAPSVGSLKRLRSTTGAYLWTTSGTGGRSATPATFSGAPVLVSNQARANLTKGASAGVCSEGFYGAWQQLVIAMWGVTEILVNPYDSNGFANGDVLVRAFQTCDIGLRHPQAFCYVGDFLTP